VQKESVNDPELSKIAERIYSFEWNDLFGNADEFRESVRNIYENETYNDGMKEALLNLLEKNYNIERLAASLALDPLFKYTTSKVPLDIKNIGIFGINGPPKRLSSIQAYIEFQFKALTLLENKQIDADINKQTLKKFDQETKLLVESRDLYEKYVLRVSFFLA
jgi:hypothetical protein